MFREKVFMMFLTLSGGTPHAHVLGAKHSWRAKLTTWPPQWPTTCRKPGKAASYAWPSATLASAALVTRADFYTRRATPSLRSQAGS